MKQTLAQRLMNEHILLGGEIMTRAQAVEQLRADGYNQICIDIMVFGEYAVSLDLDMSNIEDSQVQARLLAVNEQRLQEDRDVAEFYDSMAEAQ